MRITNNRKGTEKHLKRIKKYIPDTGTVQILHLTEKTILQHGVFQAEEEGVGVNDYIPKVAMNKEYWQKTLVLV